MKNTSISKKKNVPRNIDRMTPKFPKKKKKKTESEENINGKCETPNEYSKSLNFPFALKKNFEMENDKKVLRIHRIKPKTKVKTIGLFIKDNPGALNISIMDIPDSRLIK